MIDARQRYASNAVVNGIRLSDHIGLVGMVVKQYERSAGAQIGEDDLWQAGMMGLVKGLERFDHTRGVRISSYVLHWIRSEVRRTVENESRTIRVPTHRWKPGAVFAPCTSLDAPRPGFEGETLHDRLESPAPGPDELVADAEDAALRSEQVSEALSSLPGRLQTIVVASVVDEATLEDIGRSLPRPVTRERARQLREVGLRRLREEIDRRQRITETVASRTNTAS